MSFFRAVIYLLMQRRVYPYIAYRGMAFQKFRWEVLTVKYAPRKCTNLLTSGRLNAYLADIDRQAQERFERLIEGMKQAQGITERLKEEYLALPFILKIGGNISDIVGKGDTYFCFSDGSSI